MSSPKRSLFSLIVRISLPSIVLLAGPGYPQGTRDVFLNPVFRTTVGSHPLSVAAGDFNGDGRSDLAVANAMSNDVSILLGSGDGSFGPQTRIAVGTFPYSVAVGDLNGDGRQDLAVANNDSRDLSIVPGLGDGTFGTEARIGGIAGPFFVTTGDFNGDGRLDLAATEVTHDVVIFLGAADGTLTLRGRFGTGGDPRSIAVGDLNADGIQDLAIANYEPPPYPPGTPTPPGQVSILLGVGDGSFSPETRATVGRLPFSVAGGDFNGDGRRDLAVANSDPVYNQVSILLGLGDGRFEPAFAVQAGNSPNSVAVGDFNADGRPDLAVANTDSNDVMVLTGTGDGHFSPGYRVGAGDGAFSVALADFSGDGRQDLAVVGPRADDLRVVPGAGDGTFGPRTRGATGDGPESVAMGDLNGDGLQDLATANKLSDDLSVLLSVGDGTFAPPSRFPAGRFPVSVAIADVNGDGAPDLLAANSASQDVSVLLALPGGGFGPETRFPAGGGYNSPHSIAVGDFNRDGRFDLAVANDGSIFIRRGFVSVLLGAGDGTFAPQMTFDAGANPGFLTTRDFNNDGRTDLAVADFGPLDPASSPDILILLGVGDGTFGPPLATGGGDLPRSIAVADFNGDGFQDLAVARASRSTPSTTPSEVSIMLGVGDGTFGPETRYPTTLGASSVVAADFDHDGRQDVAVANSVANDVSLLLGRGDGTFGPQTLFAAGAAPFSIAAGDLNGDAAPDLAFANLGSDDVWVLLNRLPPLGVTDFTISVSSPLGKGSGTVRWTTHHETDLAGFNLVLLDSSGARIQLNPVLIACEACETGGGMTYTYFVPKHRGGKSIFLEAVHLDGRREIFGPAQKH